MHAMWHKTGNTLSVIVKGRQMGSKKGSSAAHQQELRPAEDQLGDAPVPPRDLEQEKERELVLCKIFYRTNTRSRSKKIIS